MADGTWEAMSLERLRAAKTLLEAEFWRDSISRSYYDPSLCKVRWPCRQVSPVSAPAGRRGTGRARARCVIPRSSAAA